MSRATIAQSQNLFTYSDDFSNVAWIKDATTNPTVTTNQIANPINGTIDADLLTEGVGTGFHRIYQGFITLEPNNYYTISCFMKDNDRTYGVISLDGGSEIAAVFNLQAGSVSDTNYAAGNYSNFSANIKAYGNGWYRVSTTFLAKIFTIQYVAFSTSSTGLVGSLANAGQGKSIYLWRAQIVQANWSGDPLQTTSSTVTTPIRNIVTSRATVTSRAAITSRTPIGSIDPRTVPALMSGGIWLPGIGVTSIGVDGYTWASQATQSNVLTTAYNFDKAVPTTASNGASVWDYPKTVFGSGFLMLAAGSALRFATKGSYAAWFKANELDDNNHFFFDAWPEDAVNNRFYAYKNVSSDLNGASTKVAINGSPLGIGDDAVHDRWKYNNTEGIQDFSKWNFIRITFDYSLDNYTHDGGNFSRKMNVYFNEVLDEGAGYSAPPSPYSAPPDGPVTGTGLYSGVQRLCLGCNYASTTWNGQVGPFYVANGDDGLSNTVWRRVMQYSAPR